MKLSRMNVLIGPSASGKSICAKLLFFFKESIRRMAVEVVNRGLPEEMDKSDRELFVRYFPARAWGNKSFEITYTFGEYGITVKRKANSHYVSVKYSPFYHSVFKKAQEIRTALFAKVDYTSMSAVFTDYNSLFANIYGQAAAGTSPRINYGNWFVPDKRSFFATFDDIIHTLHDSRVEIDPFLTVFGRQYESMRSANLNTDKKPDKRVEDYIARLICGTHEQINARDYIRMKDRRLIPIEVASSGQQEMLPLCLVLRFLKSNDYIDGFNMVVEEPEAHLYPTAQRDVVHLLAIVADLFGNGKSQYFITTHSPYILAALNNLMYGGKIVKDAPDKRDKVLKVLPESVLVDPANVRAYMMENGSATSIIDSETGLIVASAIDNVSNDLSDEFGRLLDAEFERNAA